jgi:(1->4)-alpha-D-glucan 1-alpha-D-glucosylmutase
VFAKGDYIPVAVTGALQDHIIAFARVRDDSGLIVAVPRLTHGLLAGDDRIALDPRHLRDSQLITPRQLLGRRLKPLLTDGEPMTAGKELPLASLLSDFPMSVLYLIDSA